MQACARMKQCSSVINGIMAQHHVYPLNPSHLIQRFNVLHSAPSAPINGRYQMRVHFGAGASGDGDASKFPALTSQVFRSGNPVADTLLATLAINATNLDKTNEFDVNTFYVKVVTEVTNILVSALPRRFVHVCSPPDTCFPSSLSGTTAGAAMPAQASSSQCNMV